MIQEQVLNHIIFHDAGSFVTKNNIDSSFFSNANKEQFEYIKEHIDKYGKSPDPATFVSKFPSFRTMDVSEPESYLLDSLYEDKNKRFMAATVNKVAELARSGDVDAAIKLFTQSQGDLASSRGIPFIDILKDTSRYDSYVDKCANFDKYYVKTGFDELDEVLGGWDRKEEMATIAARPGVGKTWVLLKCAIAAAKQGLNVGLYEGEMSEDKTGYRIDTLMSHISNGCLLHGNEKIDQEYKMFLDRELPKIKGSIKMITPPMLGHQAGVNDLRAFVEKENLDMLCIDQYSLMDDDRGAKEASTITANIAKDLKNLQVMKKIPIIALSQQNRGNTDEGPGTENVAGSDKIPQYSTCVIFLELKDDILTMTVSKARDGGLGKKIKYAMNYDKGVYSYIPSEDDALDGSKCEELRNKYERVEEDGDECF